MVGTGGEAEMEGGKLFVSNEEDGGSRGDGRCTGHGGVVVEAAVVVGNEQTGGSRGDGSCAGDGGRWWEIVVMEVGWWWW
jgi:hypothetical protein